MQNNRPISKLLISTYENNITWEATLYNDIDNFYMGVKFRTYYSQNTDLNLLLF